MRPFLAAALAALLLAPALATAHHVESVEAERGLAWLRQQQRLDGHIWLGDGSKPDPAATAWSAIAFARDGVDGATVKVPGGASLLDAVLFDARHAETGNDLAREVLAMVALKADPRSAAGFDAVAAMVAKFDETQFDNPLLVNDDIFFLQALHAAGFPDTDPVVQAERAFVAKNQLPTGAWAFASTNDAGNALLFADVDTTSQAVVALIMTGTPTSDLSIQRALVWMKLNQGVDGGCTWAPINLVFAALDPSPATAVQSNSDSTSWAIMGVRAGGQDPQGQFWTVPVAGDLVTFLLGLQQPDGHFQYRHGAESYDPPASTAWAVIALLQHNFAE